MTSELGCVTPWIVAPQAWSKQQLDHQVKHLFASLYSNAGANCNSPKVVILPRDWPQAKEFVQALCQEMERNPVPSAYYPGSKERWTQFRNAYPGAKEYGDHSAQAAEERQLVKQAANLLLLPWLVVDGIHVNLSSAAGRQAAAAEYAFRTEPFAPVVTFAYVDNLRSAVQLANDHLYGSLSCTLVAPNNNNNNAAVAAPDDIDDDVDVEQAIADLKYGVVAVNCWSALGYIAPGGTWGAFPGEKLENVESGIGQVHNYFFVPHVEKTVLRTPMMDAIHPMRKPCQAATNEFTAIGDFTLQPGIYTLANLLAVMATGRTLPPRRKVIVSVALAAPLVAWLLVRGMKKWA